MGDTGITDPPVAWLQCGADGGADDGAGPAEAERAACEGRVLRAWWRDERPGWTEGSWWDLTLRDEVRRLLWLPAGPLLAAALELLGQQAAAGGPGCPHPHCGQWSPGGATVGHAPGWPIRLSGHR